MNLDPNNSLPIISAALTALMVVGCQQKMAGQPSYKPLDASDFFADHRSARPLVPGTVARGQLRIDTALYTGRKSRGGEPKEEQQPAPEAGSDRARRFDENRNFVEEF